MWCTHQRFKFFSYNSLLDEPSYEPISERPLLTTLSQIQFTHTTDQIDEIINDQIVSTRYGGYHRFLVRRKGLPDSENTWINREELQRLDVDHLKHYESWWDLHSTRSSFFQP